jgi:ABC-type Na+ efflux pump permease subunit
MNLPIAERELRVAARSPRTYRMRMIACFIFSAISGWMFWFITYVDAGPMIAPQTYAFIAHAALFMAMFCVNVTADALSSEKRDGTLGLLFLTDLRSADIVFGKLAALGIVSFYGLLAMIPPMAMPLLMGGVSGQSVFRTAITLLNSLFLGLSIGLWISAKSWDQKRAMNGAMWIVILILWMLPLMSTLLRMRYGWIGVSDFLYLLSPMYQQNHATPFGVGMLMDKYWTSVAITHVLAWLALWRACAILPHEWQDRAIVSARGRLKKFWEELRFGSPEVRGNLRDRLLRINAVHWLSSREKSAPMNSWLFVIAVLLGWVGIWLWFKINLIGGPPFWGLGMPAVMILYLGLRVRTCGLSGEVIARDRLSGALELLLSTTLTERDVVRGQALTFARTLLGPAIATLLISAPLFLATLVGFSTTANSHEMIAHAWFVYIGLIILFACDLTASFWTGLWTACFAKNVQAAAGQAVIRLLGLPWIIFMACMSIGAWLMPRNNVNLQFIDVFILWWTLSMTNNVLWMLHSRTRFYERLRLAAAERYQPPRGISWWRNLLRRERAQQIGLSKLA